MDETGPDFQYLERMVKVRANGKKSESIRPKSSLCTQCLADENGGGGLLFVLWKFVTFRAPILPSFIGRNNDKFNNCSLSCFNASKNDPIREFCSWRNIQEQNNQQNLLTRFSTLLDKWLAYILGLPDGGWKNLDATGLQGKARYSSSRLHFEAFARLWLVLKAITFFEIRRNLFSQPKIRWLSNYYQYCRHQSWFAKVCSWDFAIDFVSM